MITRVWLVMWKELLELRQDPKLFPVIIVAPIIQLTFLGYAASTDVKHVPMVVVDQDRSAASRDLIARFEASPNFTIAGVLEGTAQIDSYLSQGRAWMALTIPPRYAEQIAQGRPTTVQVVADGSDANSTNVALGYATNLVAGYAEELQAARHPSRTAAPGIDARIRVWFNPRLESRDFMVPGVVALLLLLVTTNLSSMAVVREKEKGTLEQLNVTPLGRMELILGKLLPYAVIGMLDVLLVLAITIFWFEIPLRGSLLLLLSLSVVYLLTTLGLGLFVSTISETQQQAMMTATFFFLTPMIYLSGFIFPIENMPAIIQPITYLIPLRYFIVILRGIFLKGVGLETLWPQALAMLACGVGLLSLAVARSQKRID